MTQQLAVIVAAHPTTQYMAQGACMALEDAVTLGEALRVQRQRLGRRRFDLYQRSRVARTARIVLSAPRDGPPLPRQGRRAPGAQRPVEGPHARALLRRDGVAGRLAASTTAWPPA
ncbi:MAG: hypothetical protein MZV65_48785 [Chromatiales bacterium]|nr:hypothetical protein [Chromatiales bacterium]